MIDADTFYNYQAPANSLAGKIILVTGAGDGVGRAASLAYAEAGATVILMGRTQSKLEQVYDAIEAAGYAKPAIVPFNFEGAAEQDYIEIKNVLATEFNQLDGLLHNAAELGPCTPLVNYSLSYWHKLMQVNVTAPFILTKTLLPMLQESDNGSIVFTGSSVSTKGKAYWGAYSASKGALENLMQVLADELDGTSNVRTNSINPGPVRTRMRASVCPAEDPATVATPESIMNQYLFLMNADSIGISGQQFNAQKS
ncbi:YciK family oxidoreductase [Teredinibacter waterburyi]|jgi:Dehydrogenases with different specificities (related to short-chain alcohol dehydrogenases)|uniref:YciK family oxidoreductase n=1 Tax=Teredinibacter waterburyi TaxID=1500538 RepID=UPI00165F580C|nr:YciK family oxidoreductase [Teredinibacter waterburyi]